ncbi:2-carboxy-1,4-naphthoquinone phytyltransferase [Spirulina major]|uniref:2-carboxy-1,4-naphthoquinone phytyltransferase n=1 Tax=Spirulina major TaxID=270636 RepID=UPI0009FDE398|nr:2-carboxy-1,4-naphthoquinone phytyltransferase [Spirulina major]
MTSPQPISPSLPSPPSQKQLWKAAIKLPMYSVAVMPILMGTAIAYGETGQINGGILSGFLTGAIAILAWINLSNDVFDADTGIDRNKAHSIVNLTQNKSLIFWLSLGCLGVGILSIVAITYWVQDWRILGLIIAACFLGYTYQGPPFRLGYLGLGEPICFVTFGPMAIAAAIYSQSGTLTPRFWAFATLIGLTTTLILFCSHFHQETDDLAAGKRSPIVRLGTARGADLLTFSVVLFGLSLPIGVGLGLLPLATLFTLLSLPIGVGLVRHVRANHDQPERVQNCKFIAIKLHFWSGLLLILGVFLPTG